MAKSIFNAKYSRKIQATTGYINVTIHLYLYNINIGFRRPDVSLPKTPIFCNENTLGKEIKKYIYYPHTQLFLKNS